jgi:hypothetical protein
MAAFATKFGPYCNISDFRCSKDQYFATNSKTIATKDICGNIID